LVYIEYWRKDLVFILRKCEVPQRHTLLILLGLPSSGFFGYQMKKLTLIGFVVLAVGAQASPVIFYGGDFDGSNGLASQINGPAFTDVRVYDNFSLATAMNIDGVFGNFQDSGSVRGGSLSWEIRSGVSVGNGGTLLFSGNNAATTVATGNTPFSKVEYTYSAGVSSFLLGPGNYFLSVAVDGGDGSDYVSTTSGAGGVGGPLADGNSFLNSPSFGFNFNNASDFAASATGLADFSFGLRGSSPVPEPASMAVLGLGAIALLRRRRK
jgi:hypothetical protein